MRWIETSPKRTQARSQGALQPRQGFSPGRDKAMALSSVSHTPRRMRAGSKPLLQACVHGASSQSTQRSMSPLPMVPSRIMGTPSAASTPLSMLPKKEGFNCPPVIRS